MVTLGNTLLGDGEMAMLVMCRMNLNFIVFMCEYYSQVANEQFAFGTILTVEDKEEDEDEQKIVYLQDEFILDRDQSPPCHPHV